MRNHFWNALYTTIFQLNYLERYYKLIANIERAVSIVIALSSAASVASWAIWNNINGAWAIVIAIAQILQLVWPLTPYSRQISVLKYHIEDLRQLSLDIEHFWYATELQEEPEYIEHLQKFRQRHLDSEVRFLGIEPLPEIGYIYKRAEDLTQRHLNLFFGADEGSEADDAPAE